jgi:hypothetical protein
VELLEFDEVVRPLRTERHVEAALVMADWLVEPDRDTASELFVLVQDQWLFLDGSQRDTLVCDALSALGATVPVATPKYLDLLRLPE